MTHRSEVVKNQVVKTTCAFVLASVVSFITLLPSAPAAPVERRPVIRAANNQATVINPTLAGTANPMFRINARVRVLSPSIFLARGPQAVAQMQKLVTVEGFYYDGSIPMIVDDIRRTQMDMVMPVESYVPLASRLPQIKNGARIAVTGRLVAPLSAGLKLQSEPSALRVESSPETAVKVLASPSRFLSSGNITVRHTAYPPIRKPTPKYAVLIAGGYDEANNHPRYWNDLKTMYSILRANSYPAAHITVIYADGTPRDDGLKVDYSATKANIQTVFTNLGAKLADRDDLYVMVNDHGGGFLDHKDGDDEPGVYGGVLDPSGNDGKAISEAAFDLDLNGDGDKKDTVHFHNTLVLWGESMTDDEFNTALSSVPHFHTMDIQMKQCFSGGFAQRLPAQRRVVMSSCGPNEISFGHNGGNYGEFTYWYFAALTGQTPDGEPAPFPTPATASVNADTNGDNKISLLDAYSYARFHDARGETALFSDNGQWPVSGAVTPGTQQGDLGGASFLDYSGK